MPGQQGPGPAFLAPQLAVAVSVKYHRPEDGISDRFKPFILEYGDAVLRYPQIGETVLLSEPSGDGPEAPDVKARREVMSVEWDHTGPDLARPTIHVYLSPRRVLRDDQT